MRMRIFIAAITAVFLFATVGTVTAYAKGARLRAVFIEGDVDSHELFYASVDIESVSPSIIPITKETSATQPLTPSGTGTVVDNIINESGIEFFTITSANDNIFFLIIDRQRDTENVYFLNAATERDLLALAEQSGEDMDAWSHLVTPPPIVPKTIPAPIIVEVEVESAPEPEQDSNNMGTAVLLIILVFGGGVSGYYFKIYRPKQQQVHLADDFDYEDDYSDEVGFYDDKNDNPPWDIEDEENKGGDE